jgi:hypothetical protein
MSTRSVSDSAGVTSSAIDPGPPSDIAIHSSKPRAGSAHDADRRGQSDAIPTTPSCPVRDRASSPNAGETGQRLCLSVIRVNGISDTDVSISEDVGAKSATMDQWAQNALCGEALQVSAWLAETLS